MLKRKLVRVMIIAAVCGLVTTTAAKAGDVSENEKKSNRIWTAVKVTGIATGTAFGGLLGFLLANEFDSRIRTILNKCKMNKIAKSFYSVSATGALLGIVIGGLCSYKIAQLLQDKIAKMKAEAKKEFLLAIKEQMAAEAKNHDATLQKNKNL